VDVIEKITSGFPLFVVATSNGSGVPFSWNGQNMNRPDQISDPLKAGPVTANSDPACHTTISQGGRAPDQVGTLTAWFNPCAFDFAGPGKLGDANRAPLYGPGFVNTDFSAVKHFPLPFREGMMLDFRAEFFNVFNHQQLYLPGNVSAGNMQDINAPTSFGVINQTVNNPRLIQFALKLRF
jgi:hypothetical protein